MFSLIGTFITGWIWDPVTGIASSFGGWIWGPLQRPER